MTFILSSMTNKCPALSVICHKCQKKGHYSSQCLSKTIAATAQAVEYSDSEEETFLGAMRSDKVTVWLTNVCLQGKEIQLKMDTGAEVTVVSDRDYHTLNVGKLEKASRNPAHQPLMVIDQFDGRLKRGKHSYSEKIIYVVKDLHNNLLGLPAINVLQLTRRVDATMEVQTCVPTIHEQYPKYSKA